MKDLRLLLMMLALVLNPSFAHPHQAESEIEIEQLSWMSGLWSDGETEEYWSIPGGSTLHGYNRKIDENKTIFFENLTLQKDSQGLIYWASPLGKNRTPFRMTHLGRFSVSFSNPEHDFPQNIVYVRENDVLTVTISGQGHESTTWRWHLLP